MVRVTLKVEMVKVAPGSRLWLYSVRNTKPPPTLRSNREQALFTDILNQMQNRAFLKVAKCKFKQFFELLAEFKYDFQ